jgi:hypothetical protein
MSIRRMGGVLVVALTAAAAALVPSASAISVTSVTPISIGAGNDAAVTVDAAGTAHIAFNGNEPGSNTLHYCKLPRGATACSVQSEIPGAASTTSLEHPFVVVNGNTIQVVSYRYGFSSGSFGQDIVFTSTDGGATWGGSASVGQNPFYLAILGPGNAVSTITRVDSSDGGTIYQRVPLDGSSAGNTRANLSPSHLGDSSLGLIDANTPIATMSDLSDNAFWRRYTGAGDPNDAANWTPEQPVGLVRTPHFAYGPNGVFLIGGDNGVLKSRKYNGGGFDAPVTIPGDAGEVPQAFATQDPGGRTHVVMPQITAQCCKILYATSDDGANWAARQFQLGTDLPGQMQVSAAADHLGFAVWHTGNGSGQQVFAMPIGPSAAVPELGESAGAALVSGTVLIKAPGAKGFTKLTGESVIPVGSIVDAKKGRVKITTALPNGQQQSADFYQGVFKITQAKNGLTTLALQGGSFGKCGRAGRSVAGRAAKSKTIRHLWGAGTGKFRTKGRFASAAVRGTTWDVADRCDGTLTKVKQGSVTVRDVKKRKNVVVKKGKSYLARA